MRLEKKLKLFKNNKSKSKMRLYNDSLINKLR